MHPGYIGIILLMVVSPLPPEVFMPLAGFMASQGELNLVYAILAGVAGFLISILPWYLAGRYLGEKGLNALLRRYRRWLTLPARRLQQANRWFRHYGGRAIFFSLLVPGLRNIISLPAGMSGMSPWSFLTYSTLSSLFWFSLLVLAGYLLGSQYYLVQGYLGSFYNVVIVVLVIAIAIWALRRSIRRRSRIKSE